MKKKIQVQKYLQLLQKNVTKQNMDAVLISLQLKGPSSKVVTLHAPVVLMDVVQIRRLQLMGHKEKDVASKDHSVVVLMILHQLLVPMGMGANANTHTMDVVLMESRQPKALIMKAAVANIQTMGVVQMMPPLLLDQITRDVLAIPSSLVAVLMEFLLQKVHISKDATVELASTAVVQMKKPHLKGQITKDVVVKYLNMVAALMEYLKQRALTMKVVLKFLKIFKMPVH